MKERKGKRDVVKYEFTTAWVERVGFLFLGMNMQQDKKEQVAEIDVYTNVLNMISIWVLLFTLLESLY